MSKRLKCFEVITKTKYSQIAFLTKGEDGIEALQNLINHSSDFMGMSRTEAMDMTIEVVWKKVRT